MEASVEEVGPGVAGVDTRSLVVREEAVVLDPDLSCC